MNLHSYLAHLAHPKAIYLLALLPVLSLLGFYASLRRRRSLARLGSRPALEALAAVSRFRRGLKSFCISTAVMLLILAIAGPQWGYEPEPAQAAGRDLVVVIDLSRSMLAEDEIGRAHV